MGILKLAKVLVILGSTATGKTDLAIFLAKNFNGELVACDSRQVYKGLDIGTGKMPSILSKPLPSAGAERKGLDVGIGKLPGNYKLQLINDGLIKGEGFWIIDGVKIWMYDVANLSRQYTIADYVKEANAVIEDIISRGKLPIVVGGTGLYFKALFEGLPNLSIPTDPVLRRELSRLTKEELQQKLKQLDPDRWKNLNSSDKENSRRLLRSIELILMYPYRKTDRPEEIISKKYDVLKLGLTAPREVLYKRNDLRVLSWLDNGIIEEVKKLKSKGISISRIKQLGLEYKVLINYLNGFVLQKDLARAIQNEIHSFIRRQLTWFKKEKGIYWLDITSKNYVPQVEKLIKGWYHSGNKKYGQKS